MRAPLPIAALALALLGCGDPSAPEPTGIPNDAVAIVGDDFSEAVQAMGYFNGYDEQARLVIADRDTWTRVWLRVTSISSAIPLPQVDFDRHMIIFAAMGLQPNTGYQVQITELYRRGEDIYAVVREQSPGRGCIVGQAITTPVTAALVPRIPGRVFFVERTRVVRCG